jgi:hypothetical protein
MPSRSRRQCINQYGAAHHQFSTIRSEAPGILRFVEQPSIDPPVNRFYSVRQDASSGAWRDCVSQHGEL